jgi:hypothetical protein
VPLLGNALTWAVGSKRPAAAKAANGGHRPSRCRDEDCLRLLCRGYKLGYEDGYGAGYGAGYEAGYAAGAADASK